MAREADARDAWGSVLRILLSAENQRRFGQTAEALGLTVRLQHALLDVVPDRPTPMRCLAEQWFCDASNVTGIVDALEQRGLVRRDVSPTDRRVKLVSLTDDGVALRERVHELLLDPPSGFRALSAADLRTLRALLAKAAEGYETLL